MTRRKCAHSPINIYTYTFAGSFKFCHWKNVPLPFEVCSLIFFPVSCFCFTNLELKRSFSSIAIKFSIFLLLCKYAICNMHTYFSCINWFYVKTFFFFFFSLFYSWTWLLRCFETSQNCICMYLNVADVDGRYVVIRSLYSISHIFQKFCILRLGSERTVTWNEFDNTR